jgi:hypothetical protein
MAYLGRPGATAPLTSADIPDNSITAAKIVADTIAAGDIATGAVDTAELASGAVTDVKLDLTTPALGTPASGVVTNLSGVLPVGVTGGSGLTALGTVTAGNLSNTAIVYPTGFVIGSHTAINLGYATSSSGSASSPSWVDGVTIAYTPQSGSKILLLIDAWIGTNSMLSYGMHRTTKTPAGGSMVELRCGTTTSYKQWQMSSSGDVWQLENVGGSIWDVHGQDGSTEITYKIQCARQGGSNVHMGRPYDDPTATAGSSAATQISILEIK